MSDSDHWLGESMRYCLVLKASAQIRAGLTLTFRGLSLEKTSSKPTFLATGLLKALGSNFLYLALEGTSCVYVELVFKSVSLPPKLRTKY